MYEIIRSPLVLCIENIRGCDDDEQTTYIYSYIVEFVGLNRDVAVSFRRRPKFRICTYFNREKEEGRNRKLETIVDLRKGFFCRLLNGIESCDQYYGFGDKKSRTKRIEGEFLGNSYRGISFCGICIFGRLVILTE